MRFDIFSDDGNGAPWFWDTGDSPDTDDDTRPAFVAILLATLIIGAAGAIVLAVAVFVA